MLTGTLRARQNKVVVQEKFKVARKLGHIEMQPNTGIVLVGAD